MFPLFRFQGFRNDLSEMCIAIIFNVIISCYCLSCCDVLVQYEN